MERSEPAGDKEVTFAEEPHRSLHVFIHVPKTGGTTVLRLARRNFDEDELALIPGDDVQHGLAELRQDVASRRFNARFVAGHFSHSDGEEILAQRDRVYHAFLRRPVSRIISHYHYVRRRPDHYLHDLVIDRDLDVVDYVTCGTSGELSNGQTRLLAGSDAAREVPYGENPSWLLDRAWQNVESTFGVLGVTEDFDRSLLLLADCLGWGMPYYIRRNTRVRSAAPISPSQKAQIAELNRLDDRLYDLAVDRLDAQWNRSGKTIDDQLEELRRVNKWLNRFLARPLNYASSLKSYVRGKIRKR